MTRPRCEVCGCPMRAAYDAYDGAPYAECRPCALDVDAPVAARFHGRGDRYDWDWLSRYAGERTIARSMWSPTDANDTANTAATSTWLPDGGRLILDRWSWAKIAADLLGVTIAEAFHSRKQVTHDR